MGFWIYSRGWLWLCIGSAALNLVMAVIAGIYAAAIALLKRSKPIDVVVGTQQVKMLPLLAKKAMALSERRPAAT